MTETDKTFKLNQKIGHIITLILYFICVYGRISALAEDTEFISLTQSHWQNSLINKGNFYFSQGNTLVIFNETNYKHKIQFKDSVIIRQNKKGQIFYGTLNDIGYIRMYDDSVITFSIIKNLVQQDNIQIGQVTDIFFPDDNIYFTNRNTLFTFEYNKIDTIITSDTKLNIFSTAGELIVSAENGELYIYDKHKFKSVLTDNQIFKGYFLTKKYIFYILYALLFLIVITTILLCAKNTKIIKEKEYLIEEFNVRKEELVERNQKLLRKNKKNEELLAKLLPAQTADELRARGKAVTHRFELVTILFADIQGFTKIAETLNPEILIDELDKIFFYFDSVVEKYNIEKIKTIGDAYMCAGGIPVKNRTNPVEVVLAALDMQHHIEFLHQNSGSTNSKIWNLRIGIHTGPVISGVIGKRKFSYDIWGDSVNVASRMESSGAIGRVNISSMTYNFVKDFFDCEYRGKMPVKYKGEIEMYFVNGIKNELSEDGNGLLPNKQFKAKFALVRFDDLADYMYNKINDEISSLMYYHNVQYTKDLIDRTELIAMGEHVDDEIMLSTKTAALFYAYGFTVSYFEFIDKSIEHARQILTDFDYSLEQIEAICQLLRSVNSPKKSKSLEEQILFDAIYDYLGSFEYDDLSKNLYKELKAHKQADSVKSFYKNQMNLIKQHDFYTHTASVLRDVPKEIQLKIVHKLINNL